MLTTKHESIKFEENIASKMSLTSVHVLL